ncbi:MAG: hypothetical protein QMC93_02290 [Patescibacteria group bacterium]|nr:hypothetical protein [Patescibacteria group bacterium]
MRKVERETMAFLRGQRSWVEKILIIEKRKLSKIERFLWFHRRPPDSPFLASKWLYYWICLPVTISMRFWQKRVSQNVKRLEREIERYKRAEIFLKRGDKTQALIIFDKLLSKVPITIKFCFPEETTGYPNLFFYQIKWRKERLAS